MTLPLAAPASCSGFTPIINYEISYKDLSLNELRIKLLPKLNQLLWYYEALKTTPAAFECEPLFSLARQLHKQLTDKKSFPDIRTLFPPSIELRLLSIHFEPNSHPCIYDFRPKQERISSEKGWERFTPSLQCPPLIHAFLSPSKIACSFYKKYNIRTPVIFYATVLGIKGEDKILKAPVPIHLYNFPYSQVVMLNCISIQGPIERVDQVTIDKIQTSINRILLPSHKEYESCSVVFNTVESSEGDPFDCADEYQLASALRQVITIVDPDDPKLCYFGFISIFNFFNRSALEKEYNRFTPVCDHFHTDRAYLAKSIRKIAALIKLYNLKNLDEPDMFLSVIAKGKVPYKGNPDPSLKPPFRPMMDRPLPDFSDFTFTVAKACLERYGVKVSIKGSFAIKFSYNNKSFLTNCPSRLDLDKPLSPVYSKVFIMLLRSFGFLSS